jgi:hypothetical protein
VAHRIANVEAKEHTNNESTDNQATATIQHKPNKFENSLFLHYKHEKRFDSFQRDLHKIYSDVFDGSEAVDLSLIVGHRNRGNTKSELIQTRPNSSLFKPKRLERKKMLLYTLTFSILILRMHVTIEPKPNGTHKQTIKTTANSSKPFKSTRST